jgi:adenosylhomocysteine nucleosidase
MLCPISDNEKGYGKTMNIALICAFDEEINLLRSGMTDVRQYQTAGIPITEGRIAGHAFFLCLGGIGKANSAATTQYVIDKFSPDCILNIGLAGNCTDTLPLGGLVIADRLLYHDFDMNFAAEGPPGLTQYEPDEKLRRVAVAVCAEQRFSYVVGTVATGDQFIGSTALRDDIVARTGCACVEMEAAALAHIAHKNDVPYLCIKVMSDNADDGGHDAFVESMSIGSYSQTSAGVIAGIIRAL